MYHSCQREFGDGGTESRKALKLLTRSKGLPLYRQERAKEIWNKGGTAEIIRP